MQKSIILLLLVLSNCFMSQAQEPDFIIKNVSIVSMKDNVVLKNKTIGIKEGKIIKIADKIKGSAKEIVNAKGKYLMPSLSDAHVHFPATEEEMQTTLKLNLINGITKLRSMRGDWNHILWRDNFNAIDSYFPKLYLSPTPISRGHDLSSIEIEDFVKAAKKHNIDFIKILSVKNQSTFKLLDSICAKYEIPLAGHYPRLASGNELNEAIVFNSNYTSFEHLGGLAGENDETITK